VGRGLRRRDGAAHGGALHRGEGEEEVTGTLRYMAPDSQLRTANCECSAAGDM
jgi:hypothetical protein